MHNIYKLCNISKRKPGRMNERLDVWWAALEENGLSISKCKTKAIVHDFGLSYLGIDTP